MSNAWVCVNNDDDVCCPILTSSWKACEQFPFLYSFAKAHNAKMTKSDATMAVFVVDSKIDSNSRTWPIIILSILFAKLIAGNDVTSAIQSTQLWKYTFGSLATVMTTYCVARHRKEKRKSTVTVNPIGVQLSPTGIFIPRQDIIDVVVHEIVLSYKVYSALLLRVSASTITAENSIYHLLSNDEVQMIHLFPEVELSYRDCIKMRSELSKALGID